MTESTEDDYIKLEKLGEGAFGEVFKGRKKYTSEISAMKYMSKFHKTKKELDGLRNEITIMQGLAHPHIIQLLDSFETKDDIVVVIELATGELFSVLIDEGGFAEDKVRDISCQMSSALYYLHAHRVLHRDLKPENVLIGKGGVIKLCDFGFARAMGRDSYYAKTIKGTPLYMAPELMDETSYTEKVDLWALGCIMYELFVGRPPFCSMSPYVLHKMIVEEPVTWPNNFPSELKDLLQELLIKNPRERSSWPDILKHGWFRGGIKVSDEDLALNSPYTKPEIAAQKQKEHSEKVLALGCGRSLTSDVTDGIRLDRVVLYDIEEEPEL
ncbi:serine/threonine-protein kinase 36-like [Haliotis cracherodii]|uniref:serine/threonine-protein kinase 36-like n=1 Tax=Haliotis cracherodii TaxID=6455 RepID=UPI0039E8CCEF